ncbi:uncharacterized protein LOC124310379 [Neodiprion virginianus]|uniref:uncharacterized protein LOC124310379 n=1 Tax=Neodiprion virginianus TaxID=2961670 RepID=UPI001EE6D75F|nr:uncharacterized protein LOC124310379 [Neodiprion virginianus]
MPGNILLWIILGFFGLEITEGQISCYQCNVDKARLSNDCSDPYVPSPLHHLLPCPETEPHHCLKAAIFYNNHHFTVRACMPSKSLDTYCAADKFASSFSGAEISCYYCEYDACNHSTPRVKPAGELALGLFAIVVLKSAGPIIG